MSKQSLGQVVQRAISDAAFRRQLQADPAGALKGSDLSSAERAALGSGDAAKLASLGVDQRMSKIFMLGDASMGVFHHGGTSDLQGGTVRAAHEIPGGSGTDLHEALTTNDGSDRDAALIAPNDATRGGGVMDGGADDIRGAVSPGDIRDSSPFLTGSAPGANDAFLSGDEAGSATIESGGAASPGHGMVIDSADAQREMLEDTTSEHGTGDLQQN